MTSARRPHMKVNASLFQNFFGRDLLPLNIIVAIIEIIRNSSVPNPFSTTMSSIISLILFLSMFVIVVVLVLSKNWKMDSGSGSGMTK